MVLHLGIPDCLENYYQEAGRAGRDGEKASASILYNTQDEQDLLKSVALKFPERDVIKRAYTAIMNFLQIPGGYGAGNSYDFDLKTYCERFKIDALTATYVIKLLEQENILYFNDSFFHASTIMFTCDRATLNDLEASHSELDFVVKNLLRLYEGIFDMPVSVNEKRIASFSGVPIEKITFQLKQIAALGILQYKPQKETPQITLLQNRMYDDSFFIDLTNFLERKKQYEIRLKNMIAFLHTNNCRSKFIGNYFGDDTILACGVCDSCIEKHNQNLSGKNKKAIL
jgi:ATP-dependent DNA helicase RecQ